MLVLSAAALTFAITFSLTLYACTTSTDFTVYGASLFMVGIGSVFMSNFKD